MPSKDRFAPYLRAVRLALLILVPPAALGAWHVIQPNDRLACPPSRYVMTSLVYDEYDITAMAMRGLNAELGRTAGAPANPASIPENRFSQFLESPRPWKSRYFLEYPHAALLIFRAGFWVQPHWRDVSLPPGLPDAPYHNVAGHAPETDAQFAAWRVLVRATQFYAGFMFVCWVLLILVLEWGYTPEVYGGTLLLLLPGVMFFILNRFDVLPALLTALALAALGRRNSSWAGVALGLATLIKVYPILFAPLVLRYLWSDRRAAWRFAVTYGATGLLALAPVLAGADWTEVIAPYKFQLTRPAEHGLTIYGSVVPVHLAEGTLGTLFRLGTLATVSALMVATPITSLQSLLRRGAAVLIVFVTLAVFYSPQWIVWFTPLLLPLARRERSVAISTVALDLINYLTFPCWFWVIPAILPDIFPEPQAGDVLVQLGNGLRLARFLCCGFLVWRLLRPEYPWRAWFATLGLRIPGGQLAKSR